MTGKQNPHLYELLAVEQEKRSIAERARGRTLENFRSNQAHFTGLRRTFTPFAVDESQGETAGERLEAETHLVKTVAEVLDRMRKHIVDAFDVSYQIDEGNTRARADIVVDEHVLAEQVPATFLLQLEKRLRELRTVVKDTPTFDPVRRWEPDTTADKEHVSAGRAGRHAAQATRSQVQRHVRGDPRSIRLRSTSSKSTSRLGEIRAYDWSGMISPGRKAALMQRLDDVIEAVKTARARANSIEIDPSRRVASKILDFVFQPLSD